MSLCPCQGDQCHQIGIAHLILCKQNQVISLSVNHICLIFDSAVGYIRFTTDDWSKIRELIAGFRECLYSEEISMIGNGHAPHPVINSFLN